MLKLPDRKGNRGKVLMVRWDEEGYQWVDIGLVPGLTKSETTAAATTDIIQVVGFQLTTMTNLIIMVNGAFQNIQDFKIIAPDQLRGLKGAFTPGTRFMIGQLERLRSREEITQPAASDIIYLQTMMIYDIKRCLIFLNGTLQAEDAFSLISPVALRYNNGNIPAGSQISILQFDQMEREDVILDIDTEYVNLNKISINYITQCLIWVGTIFQETINFMKITDTQIKGTQGILPAGTLVTVVKLE